MLRTFLRHYLELPDRGKNVVCLGGGVGTAQILKGLRDSQYNLSAIVSMADDGGSAGRLRRAFQIPPPGDLVNCLAALSKEETILKDILLYRFSGSRYGKDTDLGGQKLGNLIFVALQDIYKGNTAKALEEFSKIISSRGRVLPATIGDVNIWAQTKNGQKIYGEQNIDLGKYNGNAQLKKVYLDPSDIKAYKPAIEAIRQAYAIIAGPGDLFTTILPVLIVPQIKEILTKTKVKKIFIINIANKPFETAGFKTSHYLETVKDHLDHDIFDTIIVNNNQKAPIPTKYRYQYVTVDRENLKRTKIGMVEGDFINRQFPIYHDSRKIASVLVSLIK